MTARTAARPNRDPRRARRAAPARKPVAAARASLVDTIYRTLRQRIVDNVYAPGLQVLEEELAADLGASRTPVREALIRLHNEGLIEVVPRRGMRVLPVSPTDMREIYEILTALESVAAELVARRRPTEAELAPLDAATRDMARALKADDLDAWAEADERFHRHLVELSGNRMLVQSVLNFWDRAHRARMVTLHLRPKPLNSTKEHAALVAKLRSGDATGAVEVNRAHRERASRELLAIFERHRLQQL